MTEYTASNGVKVASETQGITGRRRIQFDHGNHGTNIEMTSDEMAALIECLDDEKDRALGRWRWPKNRDYVVYPVDGGYSVFKEDRGVTEFRNGLYAHDMEGEAARDYRLSFPNPWEDAKEGEAWLVSVDGQETIALVDAAGDLSTSAETFVRGTDDMRRVVGIRRIWPEGDAS